LKNISIVLAVYNEAETLEKEVRQIYETIISKIPSSEIIIAEDGSTDGSKEIIKELVEELGIIHSTSIKRKGYTRALRDAFKITKSPYIFFSDTGNKHNPKDFWKLYNYIDDFDLIIGVKSNRKDQNYRKALTWGYNKLLSIIFRKKISDADSGFRIYSKDLMDALLNKEWIFKELVASELYLRSSIEGYKIKEVPVCYNQRKGASKGLPISKIPKVIFKIFFDIFKLRKSYYK
jgi:glycosyltransferase involved in cell wall biosynthesis